MKREIIAGGGTAEIGPALGAPVIYDVPAIENVALVPVFVMPAHPEGSAPAFVAALGRHVQVMIMDVQRLVAADIAGIV